MVLEGDQANRWLEPTTSPRELRALAEGWWTLEAFPRQIEPELRFEPRVQPEESELVEVSVPDLMPVARKKSRFVPGDRVQTPDRQVGEVLEVQPKQKHQVLVRYLDGLELWHSSKELGQFKAL